MIIHTEFKENRKNWLLVKAFLSATVSGYLPKTPDHFLGNTTLNPNLYCYTYLLTHTYLLLPCYLTMFVPTLLKFQTAEELLINGNTRIFHANQSYNVLDRKAPAHIISTYRTHII